MRKKLITSTILLTVLAGAPVAGKLLSQAGNEFQETIQTKREERKVEIETRAAVIDPADAGVSVSITEAYNEASNEIGISWTVDLNKLNTAVSSSWTSDNPTKVNFLRIIFVDSSKFAEYYPSGFTGSNPNFLDPWNDTIHAGYDSEDPSTLGRWGVDIGMGGLINDWMTTGYDTDGDGNGIDDIPTDFADDKDSAPVMQIRNGYTYNPAEGKWDYELNPDTEQATTGQFQVGSIVPTGDIAISSGSATIRNLKPGLNYDQIAIVGTTRNTENDFVADYIPDEIDGGFANSVMTGGGGNFYIDPVNIAGNATIEVPTSSAATPKIESITPDGETDWVQYSTPTTTDGSTATVDATINYQVMEDAEVGNFNNSKTNITGITISSDSTDPIVLAESDFDDIVDAAVQDGYENPYNGIVIEGELPDPTAVPTYTEHSYTIEGLTANETYNFTASVEYESNVNALSVLGEYEGDTDAGMYVYNDIGGGETEAVMASEDITFSLTTPDLGETTTAPQITTSTLSAGDVAQTDVNVSFSIDSTLLDAEAYDPVVTKVELTSEEIIDGTLDVTSSTTDGESYSIVLDSTNSTLEGGQTLSDLKVVVTYNEMPSGTSNTTEASFDSYTTGDKTETTIDSVATSITATTPTTATVEYSFSILDETSTDYGTQPTKIELIDSEDAVVDSVLTADIPVATDGVITGNLEATGLTSGEVNPGYTVKVTYTSGSTANKEVESAAFDITPDSKVSAGVPTITNVDVTPMQDSASVVITGTNFSDVSESSTEMGRVIESVTTDIAGAEVSSDLLITDTEITFSLIGLSDATTYDGNVIITYHEVLNGAAQTSAQVTENISFTTTANSNLEVSADAKLISNNSNNATIEITYVGQSAATAISKVQEAKISYDGAELETTWISTDTTGTDVTAQYEVSGLIEREVYSTDLWQITLAQDENPITDLTLDSSFTTGYSDELFLDADYGINILNNSFSGSSFTSQLLFNGVVKDESTFDSVVISANGEAFETTFIESNVVGDKTFATFEANGLDPLTSYDNWTVKSLNPSYLTSSRSVWTEEDMIETPIELIRNGFDLGSIIGGGNIEVIVDGDGNIGIDNNGDGLIEWPYIDNGDGSSGFDIDGDGTIDLPSEVTTDGDGNITGIGNIELPEFGGTIDIDGDGQKDDTIINWPDGSWSIAIDGDIDNAIKVTPGDDGSSWSITLPNGGIFGLPGGSYEVVDNGDGSLTILDDLGNTITDLVPNGDGGFIAFPPLGNIIITDGSGETGIDSDGDGNVDIPYIDNGDGTGGFDIDGDGTIDLPTLNGHIDLGDDGQMVTSPDENGNIGIDIDGDGLVDFPLISPDSNGNIGIDLDGDGLVDLPISGGLIDTDGDGVIDGIDLDGDGEIDQTLDLDPGVTDPSKPAGYENEAIVTPGGTMKVDPSSVSHDSFEVQVKFSGKITDSNAEEFKEVKFRYEGVEVESNLVIDGAVSSNTLTYKIAASPSTTYNKDGWEVFALQEGYTDLAKARATDASTKYAWTEIHLSEDITTPEEPTTSLLWLWIILAIIVTAGIAGLIIFLVLRNKDNEDEVEESTESSEDNTKAKVAKSKPTNMSDAETFLSGMSEGHLRRLAESLYDKESLKPYTKKDLIDLLVPEDVRHLEEHDHRHQVLSKMTKAALMKLADEIYDHDSLKEYGKEDLVELLEDDESIDID